MENLYGIVVVIHLMAASTLVMTLVIMQLVVSVALSKITNQEDKQNAMAVIQTRWHPVVDIAIILLTLTGPYLLMINWSLIGTDLYLHVKVAFGLATLIIANLLHFYFRGKKRRLKANGEMERLQKMSKLTGRLERIALYVGVVAFLMGITYNHL